MVTSSCSSNRHPSTSATHGSTSENSATTKHNTDQQRHPRPLHRPSRHAHTDVDLDARTVTIRSTRIRYKSTIATSTPKTARGNRTIAIGPAIASAQRGWKRQQSAERLLIGEAWADRNGLVVTNVDGSAPNPEAFSNLFVDLANRAGLPPIRLHDLRHSYATAALATGVPVKVVSQRVGHADVGVTLKGYAHVMPGDDEDAALRADSLLAP